MKRVSFVKKTSTKWTLNWWWWWWWPLSLFSCVHRNYNHCLFCSARLLMMNSDKWVHLNCALWSYEVYETMNGSLVNVDQACKRGITLECVLCHKTGATIACFKQRCTNIYHLGCAQQDGVVFFQDKAGTDSIVHYSNHSWFVKIHNNPEFIACSKSRIIKALSTWPFICFNGISKAWLLFYTIG